MTKKESIGQGCLSVITNDWNLIEWLPYNLAEPKSEVGAETFQHFHFKFFSPNLDFILECKKFVCGG
jgi:hypothetical protein